MTAATLRDVADAALRLKALGLTDEIIFSLLGRFWPGVDLEEMMPTGTEEETIPQGAILRVIPSDAGRVARVADEMGRWVQRH